MAANCEPFVKAYLEELVAILPKLDARALAKAVDWISEAETLGHTVFTCGNGGSAAIATQMVVDMVKGASMASGRRFKALALTDSAVTITAYANDVSYDSIFVEPLKVHGEPGDVLIAISGSGNSANVLRAVDYANAAGIKTIGLTTSTGGRLRAIAQLPLLVPSDHMGRLEDSFFIVTHIICYSLMRKSD
jgi:D-sedoheptulose 7-phosphate isomerase